jgi:putative NADH-flavin reductase
MMSLKRGKSMNIVIFGANGPTGQILTQQALAAEHTVVAVTRHPEAFPLQNIHLHVMRGDVFDLASVEQAVAGQDMVLSALGVPYSRKPITVYSQGTANILQAMKQHGVRRLACVSSGGTNPHADPQEGFVFGKIIKPFFGKTLYEDMLRMEHLVMASDLHWTIARPARLIDTPTVTAYQVAQGYMVPRGHKTSRADLADFLLKQLITEEYRQKAVAIATFV